MKRKSCYDCHFLFAVAEHSPIVQDKRNKAMIAEYVLHTETKRLAELISGKPIEEEPEIACFHGVWDKNHLTEVEDIDTTFDRKDCIYFHKYDKDYSLEALPKISSEKGMKAQIRRNTFFAVSSILIAIAALCVSIFKKS